MEKKTAIIFGATGLTGSHLLRLLSADQRYGEIKVFTRSDPAFKENRIKVIIASIDDLEKHEDEIRGHDLFCCLGTTMKKAGSRKNFRKVDYDYPVRIAAIASRNNVPSFLVISSIGAGGNSPGFYLKTKTEMEKAVARFGFEKLVILRPSILLGKRGESRFMEEVAGWFMMLLKPLLRGPLRKYRGIKAETVAAAMIAMANSETGKQVYESDEIEEFARQA